MKIKTLVLLMMMIFSFPSMACELPKGEVIRVGCTYDCDFFYRFRIIMTSWMMGYSTEFINLHQASDFKKAMSEVDAVLIPGGADIHPKYYLGSVSEELRDYTEKNLNLFNASKEGQERDPFEFRLVQTYSQDDQFKHLPLLGVCRGLQMMSVTQGIPLYLDIKTELGIQNRYNKLDKIVLDVGNDSLMRSIYSNDSIRAFKFHHQAIRLPYFLENSSKYPNTRLTSFSHNRRIPESIEYTHRPAIGVQYHPEKSFTGTSVPVFKWFLKKACEYKTTHRKDVK
jgi:gamma-glutamyl-gamma-aminobutyrate hydrolase PuuD